MLTLNEEPAFAEADGSPGVSENDGHGDAGQPGRAGRMPAITSKEWAGSVVWARLAKFPWWPAQVLDESDPWIPNDSEAPRHGAIPVRFFGTYDFAWIESHRAICPYDLGHAEHSKHSRQKPFVQAMEEAESYQETQQLPSGFYEDSPPSPEAHLPPSKKSRPSSGKTRGKKGVPLGVRAQKKGADGRHVSRRSVRERQDLILRHLALRPPPDSPYIYKLNLDGVRKLLELKKAGLYPPPVPKPAPIPVNPQIAFAANPSRPAQAQTSTNTMSSGHQAHQPAASAVTYAPSLVQMSGGLVGHAPTSHMQQYTQLLQHQQFLQQQLQGHAGQTPWFMQPHLFGPQLGYGYYTAQQGGVQGALMAAANQQHLYAQQKQPDSRPSEAMYGVQTQAKSQEDQKKPDSSGL